MTDKKVQERPFLVCVHLQIIKNLKSICNDILVHYAIFLSQIGQPPISSRHIDRCNFLSSLLKVKV
jgi:hypothetical protein